MSSLKTAAVRALTLPGVAGAFRRFLGNRATVFMCHRFRTPEGGYAGDDPAILRATLAYLRRHRYETIGLPDLYRRLQGDGPPLRGAVAFTVDDGYFDQADVVAPIFAEFDCPATTFITTGFLDGIVWMWWDRIEYVFGHTSRSDLRIQVDGAVLDCAWTTAAERSVRQAEFTAWCKAVPEPTKLWAIERLAAAAEVELPEQAPPQYRPMTWQQLRAREMAGMTFGPHTVTHPILGRAPDEQSGREIAESWRRLRAEAAAPVPVFCYPNGGWTDFGLRETATLRGLEFTGAVVGEPGYALPFDATDGPEAPFRVQRFPLPEDVPHMTQYACGAEFAKGRLRGWW